MQYFVLLLLFAFGFLLAPVTPVSADPFTSGKKGEVLPAASRGPIVHIPSFILESQLIFREKAGNLLTSLKDNPSSSIILSFFLIVFIYGFLHGAGPGHRKTVVFTLFLSRKAKKWEPFAAGFLSAGLHAGTSLILIFIFKLLKRTVAAFSSTERLSFYLEGWTFAALGIFALLLIIFKILEMRSKGKNQKIPTNKNIYALLIVSSLFPCPGATMILILALSQGMTAIGVLGVIAMSLGMGTIISLVGYLAMTGRENLFRWFKNKENRITKINNVLELTSYLLIGLFALWMDSPFLYWLFTHSSVAVLH